MNDTSTTTQKASTSHLIDSNRVEGTEVFDRTGKHIGTIKRLVIEKTSGRVAYTVVSFGGFLGMGSDTYTIPWEKLSYNVDLSGYVTDITPENLEAAPAFARNASDDYFFDRDREATLNDYYGAQRYWSE